jgi:hypothetical protein
MTRKQDSNAALKNIAGSLPTMAGFTLFWTGISIVLWTINFGWSPVVALLLIAVICLSTWLFVKFSWFNARIKQLAPEKLSDYDKKVGKIWSIIFSVEGSLIGLSCALLGIFGQYEFIVPVVALIVGVHYFPLYLLYKTTVHLVATLLVVLTSGLAIAAVAGGFYADWAVIIAALSAALSTAALGAYMVKLLKNNTRLKS